MEDEGEPRSRLQLASRGPFARLWWAGAISSFGDWIEFFATLALGGLIGGSTGVLVPLLGRFIPGLLFTPLGGLLADRWSRKATMIISDLGRGALVLTLVFVDSLPQLFVVSFLIEMLALIRQPAREAVVPAMVGPRELLQANSLGVIAAYGTFPFGSLAWSALVEMSGSVDLTVRTGWFLAYAADSLTFFVSAALVASIRFPATEPDARPAEKTGWRAPLSDLVEGLRFVAVNRGVRVVIVGLAVALFGGGALVAQGQIFASRFLGGANSGFAVVSVALGAGLAAGVISASRIGRLDLHRTVVFGGALLLAGMSLGVVSTVSTVGGAALWAAVLGGAAGLAYVTGFTYLHERVDDGIRGRTFAALFTTARTAIVVSMTVASFGAAWLDGRWPAPFDEGVRLVFFAGGLVIVAAGATTLWSVREVLPGRPAPSASRPSSGD